MVNLVKSEFGHAYLTYLGHIVGQGEVRPVIAKVTFVWSDVCQRAFDELKCY